MTKNISVTIMKLRTLISVILLCSFGFLNAETPDPVLMTVNGKPILKSEFEYVYNKNNANNSIDKKTLNEYVDLFINFRLKVEEALAQGMDTTASFRSELAGYRTQLAHPYLVDSAADESILHEAYERMKEDIEVSHILIRVNQNASPKDTLLAWNKAQMALQRLQQEDFAQVAKEVSEDESVEQNNGYIGWITVFRTIYPFETMAYNTPAGKLSQPVRTMFGYHILKVHQRRKSMGEVLTAHIMKFTSENPLEAKKQIDSLYQRVLAGDDFAALAEKYSDDKASAVDGGKLPWFGSGRMIPEYESAAFAIHNVGEFSQPIESRYGWHIIKLLDKKDLASYADLRPELERRTKRDERGEKGKQAFVAKLYADYNVVMHKEHLKDYYGLLAGRHLEDSAFLAEAAKLNKELFSFAGQTRTQSDFTTYLATYSETDKLSIEDIIADKFKKYVDGELLAYEDSQLEKKYADFRLLMKEYHDGILLFEVSNKEVWERASKDTAGLQKYFASNNKKYKWPKPHFKGHVIWCKDQSSYDAARDLVKRVEKDSITKYLSERLNDSVQHVKIEKGLFAKGENKVVDRDVFKDKTIELSEEYPYAFVVGKNLKNKPEDYSDVRGLVVSDYQDYLEKRWLSDLRKKYPVFVDENVLKTVKKN